MQDENIIGAYSTANPAEMAMLEAELGDLGIEYRIDDDTNIFSGPPMQHNYIKESDSERAGELLSRLYTEDMLGSKPRVLTGGNTDAVREATRRRKERVKELQSEAGDEIVKTYWKRYLLGLLIIPVLYWVMRNCGPFFS